MNLRKVVLRIFSFGLFIALMLLQGTAWGQTATVYIDYVGANGSACGGTDATYQATPGSATFNGGIPSNATITSISVSANLGKAAIGNANFSFTLNTTAIGSISGVSAACQNNIFSATTVATYNKTGTNTLAFTASGAIGVIGVYNITLTVNYTLPAPTITGFSPLYACSGTTPLVTINGTDFTGVTAVKFSGVAASSFTFVSATQITATFPAGAGTGRITVTTPGGTGTSSLDFVFSNPVATVKDQTNINCYGTSDGTITVTASGGVGPYTFSVNDGSSWQGPTTGTTESLFTGLIANHPYRIRVKDTHDCISK